MKSNLFSKLDIEESEDFVRDFKRLLQFDESQLQKLVENIIVFWNARTSDDKKEIINQWEKDFFSTAFNISSVISVINFFSEQLLKKEYLSDTMESISSDLLQLDLIPAEREKEFNVLFKKLKEIALKEKSSKQAKIYKTGVLPKFESFGATIEIRPVFERTTLPREIDYNPKIIGAIPIVSVHIGLDIDENKDLYFQLSEDEINDMINRFQNLAKEIKEAKEKLKLK